MAYPFEGYWKDVGTLESLWEANMELLGTPPVFDIHDREWRIFSRITPRPPHYIAKGGVVRDSLITEGCEIYGTVERCVLSPGVIVEKDAVIRDSVIMSDTRIMAGAEVDFTICDSGAVIGRNCRIGSPEKIGPVTVIRERDCIPDGSVISTNEEGV